MDGQPKLKKKWENTIFSNFILMLAYLRNKNQSLLSMPKEQIVSPTTEDMKLTILIKGLLVFLNKKQPDFKIF